MSTETTPETPAPEPVGIDAAVAAAAEYEAQSAPLEPTPEHEPPAETPADEITPPAEGEEVAQAADDTIPATPERTEPPAQDAQLVRRAKLYGVDPGKYSGRDELLREMLDHLEEQRLSAPASEPPAKPSPETPAVPKKSKVDELIASGAYEADDPIVQVLRDQEARLAEYDERSRRDAETAQAEAQARYVRDFESGAEALDAEIYGVGAYEKLPPARQRERVRLDREVSHLANCYAADGEPIPDLAELQKQAHARLHPQSLETKVRKGVIDEIRNGNKGTKLPKPTTEKVVPQDEDPREAAIREVREHYAAHPESAPAY